MRYERDTYFEPFVSELLQQWGDEFFEQHCDLIFDSRYVSVISRLTPSQVLNVCLIKDVRLPRDSDEQLLQLLARAKSEGKLEPAGDDPYHVEVCTAFDESASFTPASAYCLIFGTEDGSDAFWEEQGISKELPDQVKNAAVKAWLLGAVDSLNDHFVDQFKEAKYRREALAAEEDDGYCPKCGNAEDDPDDDDE